MRTLFSALIFGLGFFGLVVPARAADRAAQPATIVVHLPADARLTIDGAPTRSTSATREFVTPPLEKGKQFHYTFVAEVTRGDQTITVRRRVPIRAGQEKVVSLNFPGGGYAAARWIPAWPRHENSLAAGGGGYYGVRTYYYSPDDWGYSSRVAPMNEQSSIPYGPAGPYGMSELDFMGDR